MTATRGIRFRKRGNAFERPDCSSDQTDVSFAVAVPAAGRFSPASSDVEPMPETPRMPDLECAHMKQFITRRLVQVFGGRGSGEQVRAKFGANKERIHAGYVATDEVVAF